MRRIGTKGGKRRKSDTSSDADSGENGGSGGGGDDTMTTATTTAAAAATGATHNNEDREENNAETVADEPSTEKATPNRKKSRSRGKRDDEPAAGTENKSEADETAAGDRPDVDSTEAQGEQENGNATTKSGSKKRKREKQRASTSQEKKHEDDEYEVEKIVSHRTIKGRRQFLVRWKGYGEDADTWEQEKDLNCAKLIEDFLEAEEDKEADEKETADKEDKEPTEGRRSAAKQAKKAKKSPAKRGRPSRDKANQNHKEQGKTAAKDEDDDDEEEEAKEFEVEKIVEVHFKKNKAREFLIRWKGFAAADDTWEPEENLNCPDLIAKFMEKVEKAKTSELRELRTNPTHTKRYTLTTHESGRRLSRRNTDKQRLLSHREVFEVFSETFNLLNCHLTGLYKCDYLKTTYYQCD